MQKSFKNWCPEVYRGVFLDRHNDDRLFVAPCCQSHGEFETTADFDFVNSPSLNKIRQQFDQDIRAPECRLCWETEDLGNKSRRQAAIEFFKVEPSNQVQLESIDYSSTWACNLACIMCGPGASSTWAKELGLSKQDLNKIGRQYQSNNNILEQLDLSCLKKIHFNGGEPFLNNDQLDLLDKADLDQLFISYNTNGTVYPTEQMIELWKKSKLVKIFLSIDATGTAFDYIRYPGNWANTSRNILRMRDLLPGNVIFGFNVSVGGHNVLELADVIDWFNNNLATNNEGDASDFCTQFVHNYDMAALNSKAKQAALTQLEKYPQASAVCNYLKTSESMSTYWLKSLNEIDQRRGTNWRNSLRVAQYY